jgi:hypothetical protein
VALSKYYPDDRGNPPAYQMKSALVSNSTKTNRSNPKFWISSELYPSNNLKPITGRP